MPKITKTDHPDSIVKRLIWPVFAVLVVLFYFVGLTIPLVGPDEPRYAEVAREMFERGDWITPTLGGFHWFEKPALLYWLEIISYHIFGVTEFAARFGPAVFGLGTILCLWLVGRTESEPPAVADSSSNASGDVRPGNSFANWLALIAASTLGIIVFSRGASFDIILTLPITAALVSFYVFDQGLKPPAAARGSYSVAALFLFYFFVGIALLAKGLIGFVFPFAIVGLYYLLSRRRPPRLFMVSILWGTVVAVAMASTWYVPMYLRHGYAFIDEFFIQHHFQRFITNKYQHPQPFYFFLWVLPLMTIPWLPFFLAATWTSARTLIKPLSSKQIRNPPASADGSDASLQNLTISPSPLLTLSFSWLLVPLVFFSFSGSKLPGYILPAVPAAVIITANYIWRLTQKSAAWRIAIAFVGLGTFTVIVLALIFVVPQFANKESVKELVRATDLRGYEQEPVLSFQTVSHNAEFYAAGRLVRDEEGKQRKFNGAHEIADYLRQIGGRPVVVLVPLEHLKNLTGSELFTTEVLGDNGDLAIAVVSEK